MQRWYPEYQSLSYNDTVVVTDRLLVTIVTYLFLQCLFIVVLTMCFKNEVWFTLAF
jgi:hypothetical protein